MAAPAAAGAGEAGGEAKPAGDDLADLTMYINKTTDESLESTRRMVALAEASKEAGIKTLVELDDQAEKLEHIEDGMDSIHEDMLAGEKALAALEACCGICVLPWQQRDSKFDDTAWKDEGPVVGANQPQRNMGDGIMIGGNYITRITDDDREKEMEENVDNVSNMVGNLRNMAIDAGQEIDNQNHLIDRINRKAEANSARVKDANERATSML